MSDAPSLADALTGIVTEQRQRGPRCSVTALLEDTLDAPDAAALQQLLDNDAASSARIAEVLGAHGHDVQAQTIARHRKRGTANGCRCPR